MKIALSGYGKMGQAIEKIALSRGHEISFILDSSEDENWNMLSTENTDVVIDFSVPESALENMHRCFNKKLALVVGTTGWYDHLEEIKTEVVSNAFSMLYASNFSIGVNLFFALNEHLAKLMAPYEDYRPSMTETHHIHKLDAPSGTAISLANGIIDNHPSYDSWKLDEETDGRAMGIRALRIDEVPGTHEITYSSEIDEINIRHEAKSRIGFALGAVVAAEWLKGKTGFFNMSDVLNVNLR